MACRGPAVAYASAVWRVTVAVLACMALVAGGCAGVTPPGSGQQATPALAASAPAASVRPSPKPDTFRIVGYALDSDGAVEQIRFDELTHVNYAFLIPHSDGTVADLVNPWKLDEIVARAHASGVRVLVSVGGWGWDDEFEAMAADPAHRATFVGVLRGFVADHALDGIDIDWEYPDPGQSSVNYRALMTELRAALPPGGLLTSAVVAEGSTGYGIPAEVFPLVDFLNVMAYDAPGSSHSPLAYAEESLGYWSGRGLPREKTVLGVPFYSRPTEVPYRKLVATDPIAASVDSIDYLGTTVNYNGIATMRAKTQLAMRDASGVMIWALPHDTSDATSLLGAIFAAAHGGGGP